MGTVVGAILGWTVMFITGILVMIHGWGLEPKHWGWIIGGHFFAVIVGGALMQLGKMVDE